MPRRWSVPPPRGPVFGWPGAVVVGVAGFTAGWLITDEAALGVVGGVTAGAVWYAVHRLVAATTPEE